MHNINILAYVKLYLQCTYTKKLSLYGYVLFYITIAKCTSVYTQCTCVYTKSTATKTILRCTLRHKVRTLDYLKKQPVMFTVQYPCAIGTYTDRVISKWKVVVHAACSMSLACSVWTEQERTKWVVYSLKFKHCHWQCRAKENQTMKLDFFLWPAKSN